MQIFPNFNLNYQVIAVQFQRVSVQKFPNFKLNYQVIALQFQRVSVQNFPNFNLSYQVIACCTVPESVCAKISLL